jgi:hypothetical protein
LAEASFGGAVDELARRRSHQVAEDAAMQVRTEVLVVCTLAPDALQERIKWIRRLTANKLTSHQLDGTTLRFSYKPDAAADLERIVAEEQKCCAFLRFKLTSSTDFVQLVIEAPDGGDADARWLFDHFLPEQKSAATPASCGCAPGMCR